MSKTKKIEVMERSVTFYQHQEEDFISLTDIAKHRDEKRGNYIIQNWLRNRNTIEFLGIWEQLNNPAFNSIEFDGIKNQAGLNSFSLTAKQWRNANPGQSGNIRDYATAGQLVCLANLENLNALFIHEEISQKERLVRLNRIAIDQMRLLTQDVQVGKLEGGK